MEGGRQQSCFYQCGLNGGVFVTAHELWKQPTDFPRVLTIQQCTAIELSPTWIFTLSMTKIRSAESCAVNTKKEEMMGGKYF